MRAITIAGFMALAVVAAVLYLSGRAHRLGLAPLGDVIDAIRPPALSRVVLAFGWAWAGWHLLAR